MPSKRDSRTLEAHPAAFRSESDSLSYIRRGDSQSFMSTGLSSGDGQSFRSGFGSSSFLGKDDRTANASGHGSMDMSSGESLSSSFRMASEPGSGSSTSPDREGDFIARLKSASWTRQQCHAIINNGLFSAGILLIIILNTVVLAVQSTPYVNMNYSWYLTMIDQVFLGIYMMETVIKLYVYRLTFLKSGWNLFDLLIVGSSVISFLLPVLLNATLSFNPKVVRLLRVFRAFRAIRSLRALRAVTFLRSLQVLVQTLLRSIPAMSSIVALAALVLYIFAVIGRSLFATVDPQHYSTILRSFFYLFSTLTLDNWSDMWIQNRAQAPAIFIFLFLVVFLEAFVFLNLFVAVICSNLGDLQEKAAREAKRSKMKKLAAQEAPAKTIEADGELIEDEQLKDDVKKEAHMQRLFEQEMGVDNYYPANLPRQYKHLTATYFMLLASLEHSYEYYHRQKMVVDELVDLIATKDTT